MERVFWIKFYEDGVFCSAIGNPHEELGDALLALVRLAGEFKSQGFLVTINLVEGYAKYDRYGTLCTLKIEEDNQ